MLTLTKIQEDDAHAVLSNFLNSKKFVPLFSYSPHAAHVWLMHQEKSLYIAELQNESALVLHREKNNDIRFLFWEPSQEMLKEVTKHFDPQFVGINALEVPFPNIEYLEDRELIIEVNAVAHLEDLQTQKEYMRYQTRHPNLSVTQYAPAERSKAA